MTKSIESLDLSLHWKMVQYIKESGMSRQIKKTEEEFRYGLMDQDMMVSGSMEKLKDTEDLFTLKETCMREIGLRIKHMVMESILIIMAQNSQEIGFLINNKATEKSNGQMVLSMKVTTKKV